MLLGAIVGLIIGAAGGWFAHAKYVSKIQAVITAIDTSLKP